MTELTDKITTEIPTEIPSIICHHRAVCISLSSVALDSIDFISSINISEIAFIISELAFHL